MKTVTKWLTALTLVLAIFACFTPATQAQIGLVSPPGVAHYNLTTNGSAIMIAGFINTNFVSVGAAKTLPVPRDGRFGFYIQTGATNALTVTNCACTVEGLMFDANGRTNVVDNFTISLTVPVNATTPYDLVTNFPSNLTDSRTYSGLDAIRILSCTNVNSQSIWLTNFMLLRP